MEGAEDRPHSVTNQLLKDQRLKFRLLLFIETHAFALSCLGSRSRVGILYKLVTAASGSHFNTLINVVIFRWHALC